MVFITTGGKRNGDYKVVIPPKAIAFNSNISRIRLNDRGLR